MTNVTFFVAIEKLKLLQNAFVGVLVQLDNRNADKFVEVYGSRVGYLLKVYMSDIVVNNIFIGKTA